MFKLKSVAVAVFAVVASASSFATTVSLVHTIGGGYGQTFSGALATNVYTIDFSAVPAGPTDFNLTISSTFIGATGFDIKSVKLDTTVLTATSNASSTGSNAGFDFWTYSVAGLDRSVSHTITVKGKQLNSTGSFTGTVTATVPEPETYAMMLAGLGVLGFLARRRKSV
jgi:hypothetical protein